MWRGAQESWENPDEDTQKLIGDDVNSRVLNRSYLIDWQDRLFQDSVLVRFEDGKLNPKATFTALAEFLDLPYTESMTAPSLVNETRNLGEVMRGALIRELSMRHTRTSWVKANAILWSIFSGMSTRPMAMISSTMTDSLWMRHGWRSCAAILTPSTTISRPA